MYKMHTIFLFNKHTRIGIHLLEENCNINVKNKIKFKTDLTQKLSRVLCIKINI